MYNIASNRTMLGLHALVRIRKASSTRKHTDYLCQVVMLYDFVLNMDTSINVFVCRGALVARIEAFLLLFSIVSYSITLLLDIQPQIATTVSIVCCVTYLAH